MNAHTPNIGHNNPPNPMEAVMAEYDDIISEAQNWADGEPVENEAQMIEVDGLISGMRKYRSALAKAGKERTAPLYKAYKDEGAKVKVITDDADLMQSALVGIVAPFKAKLAAEKEAERKAAWEASEKAKRDAAALEAKANAGNIEEMREIERAKQAALDAHKAASVAQKDTVKGMRTVTVYDITDHRAALHWIAAHDKDAMTAFIEEYVRTNHKNTQIDGVNVTTKKEAY